jgi:NAD dependent epimerase/dehydratase family enzyme
LRQRDFARALGRVLRRPSFLPTPGFAVQAAIGRGPASLALTGQRVMPAVLDAMDYHYRFGDIDAALENLVGRNATAS